MQDQGFDIWAELERVVTPENVNRIPADWNPPELSDESRRHLRWIKEEPEDCGFLRFLVTCRYKQQYGIIFKFVKRWGPFIEWKYDLMEIRGVRIFRWFSSILLSNYNLALLFFQHGCPCPERYFKDLLFDIGQPSPSKYALLGWLMDHNRLDLSWTRGPPWVNDFCERYKWRRQRCQRVAILICGMAKKSPYFYGNRDMARLLGLFVWRTRRDEEWVPKEIKH